MANPTATVLLTYQPENNHMIVPIKDTVQTVIGGALAVDSSTGKEQFATEATANLWPNGFALGSSVGDNNLSVSPNGLLGNAGGTNKVVVKAGEIVLLAITGVTGITDVGKPVYAVDGQTFTLTKSSPNMPIGFIVGHYASTQAWVKGLSHEASWLYSLMGTHFKTIYLGTVSSLSLEGTSALDLITDFPLTGRGKIVNFFAINMNDDAGVIAGAQTINLEIGTTNLTGGVLTLGFADALGAVKTATAITGNNTFNDNSVLSAELIASGTGYTAAKVALYALFIEVEYLVGG